MALPVIEPHALEFRLDSVEGKNIIDLTKLNDYSNESITNHVSLPRISGLPRPPKTSPYKPPQTLGQRQHPSSGGEYTSRSRAENGSSISITSPTSHGLLTSTTQATGTLPTADVLLFTSNRSTHGEHISYKGRAHGTNSTHRNNMNNNDRALTSVKRPSPSSRDAVRMGVLKPTSPKVQKLGKSAPSRVGEGSKRNSPIRDGRHAVKSPQIRNPVQHTVNEEQNEDFNDEDFSTLLRRYYDSLRQLRNTQKLVRTKYKNPIRVDAAEMDSNDEDEEADEIIGPLPFSVLPHSLQDDDVEITGVVSRQPNHPAAEAQHVSQIRGRGYKCVRGRCVELKEGAFIKITDMVQDGDGTQRIIGQLFVRHNALNDAKWPRRHNELVQSIKVENGVLVDVVSRRVDQVKRNRQLVLTNLSFPKFSSRTDARAFSDIADDKEYGPLFCRWKMTQYLDVKKRVVEESIERIAYEAADHDSRLEALSVRFHWRKVPTVPGGDHKLKRILVEDDAQPKIQHHHSYTYGDAFCGGGGASCGANLAGLFVKFGVDFNEKAMQTYRLNFEAKGTKCIQQSIHEFIQSLIPGQRVIDVLHISPPCQPWSAAHTVFNILNDERNEAAMFAIAELLLKLKPRAVTLEETYGLVSRHKEWFDALVRMFLDVGYSIRWTGAHLEQYGLPQRRQRLLIIATGPGETLPSFPTITHSATDANLAPLTTIHDVISSIPRNSRTISHHNVRAVTFDRGREKPSYSPHTQAKTITCSGGIGNYHPSGKRGFTMRELACLQRFPMDYKFPDFGVTILRRQIGNAVPPFVFKKIFRSVIESLKKTDGLL